jgi:transcriptional regulator with XRE-family HTH domain
MKPEILRLIAEAEVAGLSRSEIALKTGLTPRTISRYRHRTEVRKAVELLRQQPRQERAQDVLVGLLGSESESIRLQAALGIVRYGVQKVRAEPESDEDAPPPAKGLRRVFVREEPLG